MKQHGGNDGGIKALLKQCQGHRKRHEAADKQNSGVCEVRDAGTFGPARVGSGLVPALLEAELFSFAWVWKGMRLFMIWFQVFVSKPCCWSWDTVSPVSRVELAGSSFWTW